MASESVACPPVKIVPVCLPARDKPRVHADSEQLGKKVVLARKNLVSVEPVVAAPVNLQPSCGKVKRGKKGLSDKGSNSERETKKITKSTVLASTKPIGSAKHRPFVSSEKDDINRSSLYEGVSVTLSQKSDDRGGVERVEQFTKSVKPVILLGKMSKMFDGTM